MRVGLYPRVSTREQATDGYSLNEQIERLQKYCDAMGWDVYKIYTDPGYSGADMERPGLQEMIKDVQAGKLDKVVVHKLDRLSRSQLDTLYLINKVFLANDTDFVSMSENFDTSTPFGRAMIGILAVFAELERERIQERMTMGKEGRAKEGLWGGGSTVPIGYDYINGKLVINEYEAMQVREAYDLFEKDVPLRTMATIFNQRGYTRKGNEWNAKTLKNVLRSKTVVGYIHYHDEWYPGQHEAIISEEQYNRVAIKLKEREEFYKKHTKKCRTVSTLLGGMIFCKNCGARMAKQLGGSRKYNIIEYYACYSRSKKVPKMIKDPNCDAPFIPCNELDNIILEEIGKLALDPEYIKELQTDLEATTYDGKIGTIKKEINSLEDQISKLMDLYSIGGIDIKTVSSKIEALTVQRDSLAEEVKTLTNSATATLRPDEAIEIAKTFDEVIESNDLETLRELVGALISHVELYKDELVIHWRFN